MDNSARWFLTGIVVTLINVALVVAFVEPSVIPGLDDLTDGDDVEVRIVEVQSPPLTYVIVQDADGNVLVERTLLGGSGLSGSGAAGSLASAALAGRSLAFEEPRFAIVQRPTFVSAHDGTAFVTSQGRFELWSVGLDGEAQRLSLEGIEDIGSVIMDVDVTSDGRIYLLVSDGVFEWRMFRRVEKEWELMSSSILSGWPAQVVAFSVADNEAVYVTVNEPSGVFRMVPPFRSAADWVPGAKAQGIDVSADEELVLYAVPTTAPVSLAAQVRYVRDGQYGTWRSTYESCGGAITAVAMAAATLTPTATAAAGAAADGATPTATATAAAEATATATATMTAAEREADSAAAAAAAALAAAAAAGPLFPRDVAVIDDARALIVDSLSHSVLMQSEGGRGEVVFGAPCQQGSDARHLLNPRGAAVDRAGNVFITDTGNNRVVVLEAR